MSATMPEEVLRAEAVTKRFGGLVAVSNVDFTIPRQAIVSLIGSTKTTAGLRVRSELDRARYPMGVVVSTQQMAQVKLIPHDFHGDWNYTVRPNRRKRL